jgi:ribosomal protein S18 acetylase RimI-like enzyme
LDGEIIGTILCGHDGRRGYIHHLAVDQRYRRQSIGRKLVSRALEVLRAQGIRKCHLFVFTENINAMEFWRTLGFTDRIELSMMSKVIGDDGQGTSLPS